MFAKNITSFKKEVKTEVKSETVRVERRIFYLYEDGTPVKGEDGKDAIALQWAEFSRTKSVGSDGQISYSPWVSVDFESMEIVPVPGFDCNLDIIPAVKNVTPDNPPQDIRLTFSRISVLVDLYKDKWTLMRSGKPDYSFNGMAKAIDGTMVLVKNGVPDSSYTGLRADEKNRWYYLKNGIHDKEYTGIAKSTNGQLYFVKNGRWDTSYTGLAPSTDGKWYFVQKGKHLPGYTGIAKSTNGLLYFVSNGIWSTNYTGLAQYLGGKWLYVKNGKHVSDYTGVARSTNGKLYYVKNGAWDTTFSGTVQDSDGISYKVTEGRI